MKMNSFSVPTLSEVSPDYATTVQRQRDLQGLLLLAEREAIPLRKRLDSTGVTLAEGARAQRVAALLDDPSGSAELTIGLDRARLAELDRNIADFISAITELDKRVRAARAAASATICAQVESEHRRRVSAICTKLCELNDAMADYVALADDMNEQDIVWLGLVPSHASFVGRPNDKDSAIGVYLGQAVRNGNFEAKNVPVQLS